MARGFLSGLIAGLVASGVALGAVSVLTDARGSRAPQATTLEVPAGSEFNQSREDTEAALPVSEDTPDAGAAPRVEAPAPDDLGSLSGADITPAAPPETGQAEAGLESPQAGDSPDMAAGQGDDPVLPSPQAAAPAAPTDEGDLSISTDPAQPAQPDVEINSLSLPADSLDEPPALTGDAGQSIGTSTQEAPATDQPGLPAKPALAGAPSVSTESAQPPAPAASEQTGGTQPTVEDTTATIREPQAPAPGITFQTAPQTAPSQAEKQDQAAEAAASGTSGTIGDLAAGVITHRLPAIGEPAPEAKQADTTAETTADTTDEPAPDADAPPLPPLETFAVEFENPENRPLMAIVLIDDGTSPVGVEALKSFPYPLSFAVDASWPGARAAMRAYRAAGFEVLVMADLPAASTATDAEVAMQAYFSAVPEAVAVMEGVRTGLQASREAANQLAPILRESGHGLVMFPKGLNTTQKLIARAGVPSASVFRDFDAKGQNATVIRRFLDQAAFKAGQEEGGVIMVGRLRPDTISALLLWGLQDRAARVALAPISAVLQAAR